MGTPLYNTDIIPLTSRPTLTVMDDGDYFLIFDTSTAKISKIFRTDAQKALNISYDNTTSGLTATQVQAALDELVVNLGSSDSAISALAGRLDTLEGTGTGSVTKAIDDTLVPIEARVDSAELAIARQGQDLASVKQTLQQGNGATLDFSDIGSVALDARATGRANPTVEGRTATNIVDGAGIPNLGTVTFASVLNHKYFDVLHGTILTGTGSDIVVTNDTGATKNMAVIYLTSVYGSGNEPSASDCAKIFSYFDGTKSIQMPARIISKSEDETESSTLYIADDSELRSVPAISDEVKVVNGELVKVQNVQKYVLQESDIVSIATSFTNVDFVRTAIKFTGFLTDAKSFLDIVDGQAYIPTTFGERELAGFDTPTSIGMYHSGADGAIAFFVAKGTYASLAEAQADLAGTVIYYQLASPVTTKLLTSGILQAKPKGTVYYEPYYEGAHQTDANSQITLPYTGTIDKLTGYDENFEPYEIPSTGYTLVGTTLTITGTTENEVFYVELSRSEPLAPEMGVNTLNNEQVTLDSVNGKYYKITHTTANGVPTTVATEVV